MKKALALFFCLSMILCLSGCYYNPPEGYTEEHHTYEEALAFARSIDSNAIVSKKYTDTTDANDWEFREWDAVINGINCHVASVSDWVWNDGFFAGEFVKSYYIIDTDYDYAVVNGILSDNYSNWETNKDLYSKYHMSNAYDKNSIYINLHLDEYKMMDEDELEQVWETVKSISEVYRSRSINRSLVFTVPSPEVMFNHHGEEEDFVNKNGWTIIDDLSEQGKEQFFKEYREAWELLESDLPVYEEDK